MKCKHCKQEIKIKAFSGLRNFCSHECQKAHRRAYMAGLMKKKRAVSNSGGYIDMDSSNVSITNPCKKPICKGKNRGLGLSEDNFQSYGGKEWYEFAKRLCCNFAVRSKEGFCISFAEPIKMFKAKCCDCKLGKVLYRGVGNKNTGY